MSQDDPDANEKFAKVTRAYEVLKDPSQRKQYDLHGEEAPSSWSQSQYHSYSYYRDHFGIYDDDPQIVTLNMADFGEYFCRPSLFVSVDSKFDCNIKLQVA